MCHFHSYRKPVILVVMGVVVLTSGCSQERAEFTRLKLARRDPQKARALASHLKESSRGVRLAIQDIDCYGGNTRGWSAWILQESTLSREVETGLKELLADKREPLSRKIPAALILWNRTNRTIWLIELFEMVQPAGGPAVARGRKLLASTRDFGALSTRIDVVASSPIEVSIAEFTEFVQSGRVPETNKTTTSE